MPNVFPNGIEAVVKKTGWPIEAHNRWWYVNLCVIIVSVMKHVYYQNRTLINRASLCAQQLDLYRYYLTVDHS